MRGRHFFPTMAEFKRSTRFSVARPGLGAVGDTALFKNEILYRLKTRLRQARGWRPEVSCGWSSDDGSGASLGRGQLSLMTSFTPRADWSIDPLSRFTGVLVDTLCAMRVRDLDANALMNRLVAAHLTPGLATIDSVLRGRLRFAETVRPLWNRAQAPIDLGRGVTLVLAPRESIGGPGQAGERLDRRDVRTRGYAHSLGRRDAAADERGPAAPAGNGPGRLGVGVAHGHRRLRLNGCRHAIADTLVGLKVKRRFGPFSFSTTVTDVGFFAAGDTAVVRLRLAGKLRGDVWLMGVPTYDPKTRYFMLKDVSLTAASGNFLSRGPSRPAKMRSSAASKGRPGFRSGRDSIRSAPG